MPTLIDILKEFAAEVPGFMSTSVVNRADGTNIGSAAEREGFDPEATDAYFTEMLEKHDRAMKALGLESDTEDVLTTTQDALFLARPLGETDYFWILTTARHGGSMGFSRAVMRKYHDRIAESLP